MRGFITSALIGGVIHFTPAIPKFNYKAPSLEKKAEIEAKINYLDPIFYKAICKTESAWKAKAKSKVGARGIAQLMPETIVKLGVKNPENPFESIQGGGRWLLEGARELGFNPESSPLTLKQYKELSKWYNCGGPRLAQNPACGDSYWAEVQTNMEYYKKRG